MLAPAQEILRPVQSARILAWTDPDDEKDTNSEEWLSQEDELWTTLVLLERSKTGIVLKKKSK